LLPTLYEISVTLGWIYLKKNLPDHAIDIFKELVTKQPTHSTYRYHLGMAYSQKGDKTRAVEQLREALKYNPQSDEKKKNLLTCLPKPSASPHVPDNSSIASTRTATARSRARNSAALDGDDEGKATDGEPQGGRGKAVAK
jgi:tetratricopeptide (TPR) repeat protein